MTPNPEDLWFVPLGGSGEIGMNLNLFGHDGRWLMVDCGVTFEDTIDGNEVQMADPQFILDRVEDLVGIVATHAHMDHIGALPYLADQFQCPIYTTPFTARVLEPKLREAGCTARIRTVQPNADLTLGPFNLRWLPITHSTPETNGLLIETAAGSIVHTADWKIDPNPVVGDGFNKGLWQSLGDQDLAAVVCDSTNAQNIGHSISEADLYAGLLDLVASTQGRVAIGCFASNIARLQTLGKVASASGRYLCLLGRSLISMTAAAKACGYLAEDFDPISPHDLGYLPPHEVMILATGSQGEPGAALTRLAANRHPTLELTPGDRVIYSAKAIPGNEAKIAAMGASFTAAGIDVVHADQSNLPLHASGHPNADELTNMYQWLRPNIAIPVHGEPAHMQANANLAKQAGVARQLVGENGDLFRIAPMPSLLRGAVDVGRLYVDRGQLKRV
jgi:ribonuclease J